MRKLLFGSCVVGGWMLAGAGTFPYADSLTERYSLGETEVESMDEPVAATGSKMQSNEHVAVIETEVAEFCASTAGRWAQDVAAIASAQASLSMKKEDDVCVWMGCTGGGTWVPLTGKTAAEGAWQTKIEIDYSVSPRLVRYSVRLPGESTYTVLTNDNREWLALSGSAAKAGDVKLYGCGTVNGLTGRCGVRPIEAQIAASESYDMNYGHLKVSASVSEVWGAETFDVVLKNASGAEIGRRTAPVADGQIVADFSSVATPGESYSYSVVIAGIGQQGVEVKGKTDVDLFSDVDWFGFDGVALDKATKDANADIAAGAVVQKADATAEGKVLPMTHAPDGATVTTVAQLVVNGIYTWQELSQSAAVAQFALAPCRLDNSDDPSVLKNRAWAYRVGSGAWTPVSAGTVPTANGAYDVKVVFDYAAKTGNCWIKMASEADTAYRLIVSNFVLTDTKVNNAALLGGGISALDASFRTTAPTEVLPTGDEIVIERNAEVRLENLTEETAYTVTDSSGKGRGRLRWRDSKNGAATTKWAKIENGKLSVRKGAPANGLDSFHSYALGLDPEDASAKPVAVLKTDAEPQATGIEVYVKNVNDESALPQSGYEVRFVRQVSTDGGANWEDDGDSVGVGQSMTIPLDGKLYRVKTILR